MSVYVVQVKTGREVLAATMLEQHLELQVYLPQVRQRRRGRAALAPLFPGYLFVTSEPAHFVSSAVDAQPGVVRVVTVDATPCVVADAVVTALQARVAAVNAAGGLPTHSFKPGDAVRLRAGPLAGLEAVFVGPTTPSERVEILLEFLGRTQRVRMEVSMLEEAIPAQRDLHPPRRTRGHGRQIKARETNPYRNGEAKAAAQSSGLPGR
ncbi:MAG TPA: hypothetical protein DCL15_02135 [Chloroflexi bacterium]|nr:hypothetical protein [Chloroflexota bacterium]